LIKLLRYIVFEKHINILALEMASPESWHCAICIGTLFVPCLLVIPQHTCTGLGESAEGSAVFLALWGWLEDQSVDIPRCVYSSVFPSVL